MTTKVDKLKFVEQHDEQHDAVHERAGLIDLSRNGRVRVSGTEAVMFLNGLISNDMKTLGENSWMRAIFPTVQGRLIAVTRVIRLPDEETAKGPSPVFMLETEEATRQVLLKTIERFTLAGDFRVADVTESTTMFSLQGPQASHIAQTGLASEFSDLPENGVRQIQWNEQLVTAVRAKHTVEDGIDLIVEKQHGESLATALVEAGATPLDDVTFDALRIEAGIPRYGRDMDDTNVVPELGIEDAISYTKGCYIGQEIIIRIKHRGHVAKKLSRLTIASDQVVEPGAVIRSLQGTEIGRVTSAAFSPRQQTTIALGFVRYEHSAPNTELKVVTGETELTARVSA